MKQSKNTMHLLLMRWIFAIIIPAGLSAFAIILSRQSKTATEIYYTRWIFPAVSAAVSQVGKLSRYSVSFFILTIALVFCITWLYRLIILLIKKRFHQIEKHIFFLIMALVLVLFLFAITSAPNYNRLTFAELAALEIRDSTVDELKMLSLNLIKDANLLSGLISRNSDNLIGNPDFFTMAETAKNDFDQLSEKYPFMVISLLNPKPFFASRLLSELKLTGFYFPYTGEANVNDHMPTIEIPFTMLHELAHTVGYMREDEANFIAWLAGRDSKVPYIRYSATVCALNHCMNALYFADSDLYFELYKTYSSFLLRDVGNMASYWSNFDSPAATISDKINDVYLKANNQKDGVASYGRMVDLMLAEFRLSQ